MNQHHTEDLADVLSQLIKHIGDAINHDATLDIPPYSARICRVIERIEDAAFKRGVEAQRQ